MSVRNASGIGLGGALRSPQILGGMGLVVAITIVAVVFVALQANEVTNPVRPQVQPAPEAALQRGNTLNMPSDNLPTTVYIVNSEAAAETLRRAIVDGDNIRHGLGLAPSTDSVSVVANEAEAARLEAAINEGNSILAGLGTPPIIVVRSNMENVETAPPATMMTLEEAIAQHENSLDAVLVRR